MSAPWPSASYFSSGTAQARRQMAELSLVADEGDYRLYCRPADGTYWRLGGDSGNQRFLIRLPSAEGWLSFDSSAYEKQLLLQRRGGLGGEVCVIQGCSSETLRASAFCLDHSHERGVRK